MMRIITVTFAMVIWQPPGLSGIVSAQQQQPQDNTAPPTTQAAPPAAAPAAPPAAEGVVFSVDGSGALGGLEKSLGSAVSQAGAPLRVEEFRWSLGAGLFLVDLWSQSRHHTQGARLAQMVEGERAANPKARIYLVGHSSGTAVILSAAEQLPPGSVDRIVLLAPALSSGADVRPALRCTAGKVDVFCGSRDRICLSLSVFGAADIRFGPTAGRAGFRRTSDSDPQDAALRNGLQHHMGGFGGHYECTRPEFLQNNVLPLFEANDKSLMILR